MYLRTKSVDYFTVSQISCWSITIAYFLDKLLSCKKLSAIVKVCSNNKLSLLTFKLRCACRLWQTVHGYICWLLNLLQYVDKHVYVRMLCIKFCIQTAVIRLGAIVCLEHWQVRRLRLRPQGWRKIRIHGNIVLQYVRPSVRQTHSWILSHRLNIPYRRQLRWVNALLASCFTRIKGVCVRGVKWGQTLEAEAEVKAEARTLRPRPRSNLKSPNRTGYK